MFGTNLTAVLFMLYRDTLSWLLLTPELNNKTHVWISVHDLVSNHYVSLGAYTMTKIVCVCSVSQIRVMLISSAASRTTSSSSSSAFPSFISGAHHFG